MKIIAWYLWLVILVNSLRTCAEVLQRLAGVSDLCSYHWSCYFENQFQLLGVAQWDESVHELQTGAAVFIRSPSCSCRFTCCWVFTHVPSDGGLLSVTDEDQTPNRLFLFKQMLRIWNEAGKCLTLITNWWFQGCHLDGRHDIHNWGFTGEPRWL